MQQFLIIGAGAIAMGFAAFLTKASSQPKEFNLERSILTDASSAEVFAIISDFKRFPEWSPWQKLDPNVTTNFEGEQGTVGASFSWEGNNKVGAGRMTVTEIESDRSVTMRLEFLRPFAATNTAVWRVEEENGKRRITWLMKGTNDKLFQKAFAMVVNMDKMVGKDFESGLADLKRLAEST